MLPHENLTPRARFDRDRDRDRDRLTVSDALLIARYRDWIGTCSRYGSTDR
jgi:hypothetical protein